MMAEPSSSRAPDTDVHEAKRLRLTPNETSGKALSIRGDQQEDGSLQHESIPAYRSASARDSGLGRSEGKGRTSGQGRRGGHRGRGDDTRSWGGRNTGGSKRDMRVWGPAVETSEAVVTAGLDSPDAAGIERLPKRKVAVFFGYNGIGYKGSQINPAERTIEGELWQAFIKAGCISSDNADDYKKVSLARAARTDSGVHAGVNIVTLKLILEPATVPNGVSIEDWINTFLPAQIRVWRIVRVQGGFEPRKACDQRHYEYSIPTHVFLGPKPGTPMATWLDQCRTNWLDQSEESSEPANDLPACFEAATSATAAFWSTRPKDSRFAEDLPAKREWRITPELLKAGQNFVKAYEGSHNYHNYTVAALPNKDEPRGADGMRPKKGGPQDVSSYRVMRSLSMSDPFIVNDCEYVSVDFVGQSFMLHQIRKMIGLLILAVRSGTPRSLVQATFEPSRIHIPKAPALGLLLLEPQYTLYNQRIEEHNTKVNSLEKLTDRQKIDQSREQIGIQGKEALVQAFKIGEIYKIMWDVEAKEALFPKWLNYIDSFDGHDFEYLGPKKCFAIPDRAILKPSHKTDRLTEQKNSISSNGESKHLERHEFIGMPSEDEGDQFENEDVA